LLIAQYFTGYRPVLVSQMAMAAYSDGLSTHGGVRTGDLALAAEADRWAFEPRQHLAGAAMIGWRDRGDEQRLAEFERWDDEALNVNPHSSPAWRQSAAWWSEVFAETQDPSHDERALAAIHTATALYPNSGTLWAEQAKIEVQTANGSAAMLSARRALELDDQMPHADKRLSPELRRDAERIAGG
jgi:hypothetical protein